MSINYTTSEYDKKYIEWLKEVNRRLAEQLRWHPFPDEKPTEDSLVLVQFDDGHMETQHFIYDDFLWDGNCVRIPVAWMKLPKPYKKEEE